MTETDTSQNQFAVGEVATGVTWLRSLADTGEKLKEEIVEETEEKQTITRYTPLGVVVGIVPWNFPVVSTTVHNAYAV